MNNQQDGTAIAKFQAPLETDTLMKGATITYIQTKQQCITFMEEYREKSLEELRVEDYAANRKTRKSDKGGLFGATQQGGSILKSIMQQPASVSLIGAHPSTQQTTGIFEPPAISGAKFEAQTSVFDPPIADPKSILGQPSAFGAKATNTFGGASAFGQQLTQNNSLFRLNPTSTASTYNFWAAPAASKVSDFGQTSTNYNTDIGLFDAQKPTFSTDATPFGTKRPSSSTIRLNCFGHPDGSSLLDQTKSTFTFGTFGQPKARVQSAKPFGIPTGGLFGSPNTKSVSGLFGNTNSIFGTSNTSMRFGRSQEPNPLGDQQQPQIQRAKPEIHQKMLSLTSATSNLTVSPKATSKIRVKPISAVSTRKSLFDGLEKNDASLDESFTLKSIKPIYVHNNFKVVRSLINAVSFKSKPLIKLVAKDSMMVQCLDIEDKQKLVTSLKDKQLKYFTFTEMTDDPVLYVLKRFYHASCDEILELLKEEKIPAIKVTFLVNKEENPIYLVHFENGVIFNKLVNSHKSLDNVIIKWEKLDNTKKRPTQCWNCQRWGHSSHNCGLDYRCVKCESTHPRGECQRKTREGDPKCVNCSGKHAANSIVCPIFIEYGKKFSANMKKSTTRFINTSAPRNEEYFPPPNIQHREESTNQDNNDEKEESVSPSAHSSRGDSSESFKLLSQSQAKFANIPNIGRTLRRFAEMVDELSQINDDGPRIAIIIKYTELRNGQ